MSPPCRPRQGLRLRSAGLGLALLLAQAGGAAADWPQWVERWLFNSQERTQRGVEAVQSGQAEAAVEPLETALRLAPESPVATYNAGTARLEAGRDDAQPLLEKAAETGPGDLAPSANFNLGNARLHADDLQGAVDAYKEALRQDGQYADAKFNLELAQRLLQEQQQKQQKQGDSQQDQDKDQQKDQQKDDQKGDEKKQDQQKDQQQDQQQDQQKDDQKDDQKGDEKKQDPQQDQQDQDQKDQNEQQQQQPKQDEGPLPQFKDLPDMSAQEAAAILEAVENMEREQRRAKALEMLKKAGRGKKDW